jgi:hypothetical protein
MPTAVQRMIEVLVPTAPAELVLVGRRQLPMTARRVPVVASEGHNADQSQPFHVRSSEEQDQSHRDDHRK